MKVLAHTNLPKVSTCLFHDLYNTLHKWVNFRTVNELPRRLRHKACRCGLTEAVSFEDNLSLKGAANMTWI